MFDFIFKNPFIYVFAIIFGGYYFMSNKNETPDRPSGEVMAEFQTLVNSDTRYKSAEIEMCIKIISGMEGNPPAYECAVRYQAKDPSKPSGVKIENFVYAPFSSTGDFVWTMNFLTSYSYYDDLPSLSSMYK